MKSIRSKNYPIHFNAKAYAGLKTFFKQQNISKVFVLVDANTNTYCLPVFKSKLANLVHFESITIEAGEANKTIETCLYVWRKLSELDADRKSVLINLGGGMVTDLGSFVASAYRRGIKFINIPTTLLGMVDASVGGKTGVDLDSLKNQIGVFNFSEMVLIDTDFLKTLPQTELHSGYAEMLKHGLIWDELYWNTASKALLENTDKLDDLIYESVQIKQTIVDRDITENKERKILNFGHTLGHAIESYFLGHAEKETLLHGNAIAAGLILASYISSELLNFSKDKLHEITKVILKAYPKIALETRDYTGIIELLKFDKKNAFGVVNFVLLENIGTPKINCIVANDLILKAFNYYKNA